MRRTPASTPLFPYTTLFRSWIISYYKNTSISGKLKPKYQHLVDNSMWITRANSPVKIRSKIYYIDQIDQNPINNFQSPRCLKKSEEHTSELQSRGHLVCR